MSAWIYFVSVSFLLLQSPPVEPLSETDAEIIELEKFQSAVIVVEVSIESIGKALEVHKKSMQDLRGEFPKKKLSDIEMRSHIAELILSAESLHTTLRMYHRTAKAILEKISSLKLQRKLKPYVSVHVAIRDVHRDSMRFLEMYQQHQQQQSIFLRESAFILKQACQHLGRTLKNMPQLCDVL